MIIEHPGRELRGVRFRLYVTPEQDVALCELQASLRRAWNWLCARSHDIKNAREAYAERYHGVVRPVRPDGELTELQEKDYKDALKSWRSEVKRVCTGVTCVSWRSIKDWCEHFGVKYDYQMFPRACDVVLPAPLLQALCKDYSSALAATKRGQAPPSFKRDYDHVTLRTCSGTHFWVTDCSGPRPGCPNGRVDFLNCAITLPGIKGRIYGRLDQGLLSRLEHEEYRVEGISVVKETDGWYAAIRQWTLPKSKDTTKTSPSSRWRGYGLPVAEIATDLQRSSTWLDTQYVAKNGDCWTISMRDRGPQQDLNHRWRISFCKPNGHRWDPNKSCPSQETAQAWARNRIDQYTGALTPGVVMRAKDTKSPCKRGGELILMGMDAGLADIATVWSNGQVLRSGNCRARDLLTQIAYRQCKELAVGKMQTQAARRTWHMLRGVRAWIHEAQPDTIAVESGTPWKSIAQYLAREAYGRTFQTGGYVPCFGRLQAALVSDYGERLREVPREYTTRLRSQEGESLIRLDNETRETVDRRTGVRTNRDESAAREIARRSAI